MKYIVTLILIVFSLILNAQTLSNKVVSDKLIGYSINKTTYSDIAEGSPYLFNTFTDSKIYFKNNNTPVIYTTNYNAYTDVLEYIDNENKYTVSNPNEILKVIINDHILVYKSYYNYDIVKDGYFFTIIDDYISLYKKEVITNVPLKKYAYKNNDSGSSKLVKQKTQYYISIYGEELRLIKTKKKLLTLFFNHPAVVSFMDKERIKLHKEKDLIKLVTFLNNFDKNR